MQEGDIGLIGLAVMGQNLVLNMADHRFTVVVYNRTTSKVDDFLGGAAKDKNIIPSHSIEEFCQKLKSPRKVMLMVKAGPVVDDFIQLLLPHLDAGDIIIDGGNSLYTDTQRRVEGCAKHSIHYLGVGVSGGEEGARNGPSLMPGGDEQAWPEVRQIFQSIAAKVDNEACCQWVGAGGAGHYVKMVHNGIEYGDMQLITEAYHLLRFGLGIETDELADIFDTWNSGVLDSYLIEITRDILRVNDEDGSPLVDKILDSAGQKGTGKWTGINALELGVPLTLIGEAVFSRYLSSLKDERIQASKALASPEQPTFSGNKVEYIAAIRDALYASKIISYAQGFMLMRQADKAYQWNLHYGDIALMWRGGCIIRSGFLGNIKEAYTRNADLNNLLLDEFFLQAIRDAQAGWRKTVALAVEFGIPVPAFSSALAFYDGYRHETLPANLLQAQRDYFGAHTYQRIDQPSEKAFHTDWIGSKQEKLV